MSRDEYFMDIALKEAKKAYNKGEVPIGCVIVKDDKIVSRGHNQVLSKNKKDGPRLSRRIRKGVMNKGSFANVGV